MSAPENASSRERVRVRVAGRVQGVWFRESTRRRAVELGLSGWVRNLPDGRVEAEFEGRGDALEEALAFVAEGPPHASVLGVEVVSREPVEARDDEAPSAFRVR